MRLVCLVITCGLAMPAGAQAVSDQFDRISGERHIVYTADGSRDTRQPVFTFDAHFAGQAVSMGINLAYVTSAEDEALPGPRFAGCHDIAWWVDGQPYAIGRASYRSELIDGDRIELIDQPVANEWVAALGAAQSVRYRVCRDDHLLTAGDIRGFSMLAAKLKNAAMSVPVPATRTSPSSNSSRSNSSRSNSSRSTSPTSKATPAAASTPAAATEVEYQGMQWRPKHPGSMFGGK